MTDWRGLCEELVEALDGWRKAVFETEVSWVRPDETFLLDRARAALAEPEPEVVGPTDEELLELWHGSDWFNEGATLGEFRSIARAVLARWGRPAPAPAEGEVAELVEELRCEAVAAEGDHLWMSPSELRRAADLLEQRQAAPVPVPVAERLPGPEDCDAEGRCWWGFEETDDYEASWTLRKMIGLPFDDTHWLPARALPLPSGEVE